MKILHILETSVPQLVGYTIRGRYIVKHQLQLGMNPMVVTSPFFKNPDGTQRDLIEGITYIRSNHIPTPDKAKGLLSAYLTRLLMLRRYQKFIAEIVRREKPDIIHAHSSYTNGLAAKYASRRTGIPYVYELRTLWGESAVVEDGLRPGSIKYRAVWRLELSAMKGAGRIVAISQGIRDSIIGAGADSRKIEIVPNGVDTGIFTPLPPDQQLLKTLDLSGCFVVGFIGSLRRLEGLDQLIEAFKIIRPLEPRARLVIVGEGPERKRLEALANEYRLNGVVRFTGLVPHDQILQYYSIMDILGYPRIDARINHAVTPLKPLEAMAMKKICVASDVGGLKELVSDGVTGILFERGNASQLAEKIMSLAIDKTLRDKIAARSYDFVHKVREWSVIASRYAEIYHNAGSR